MKKPVSRWLLAAPALAVLPLVGLGCGNNLPANPAPVTVLATPAPNTLGGRDWTYSTLSAAFPSRVGHSSLAYQGQMWVIAGVGTSYLNDVWSSTDGANWTQALAANASPGPNQFPGRIQPGSVVFNNRMWVIGGFSGLSELNDVWSSSDGANWTQVLATNTSPGPNQFPGRNGHASVSYGGKIWVVGGNKGGNSNDVWSSSDGVSWSLVLPDTASPGPNQFPRRTSFPMVVFNNRMWVIGGSNGTYFNDVWSSSDGVSWVQALSNNASPGPNQFSQRSGQTCLVYGNGLWVIGGFNGSTRLNDVWFSGDGTLWNPMTLSAAFPPRQQHTSLVFNNEMWVLGGWATTGYYNDVWHSPF